MKKTLLVTSLAIAMGVTTTADAAFSAMGAGDYTMSITGGCFTFGTCSPSGAGAFTDNTAAQATTAVTAATVTTRSVGDTTGSGASDGINGTISFSLDVSGNMTITSYAQDSYLDTAGGTFFVDANGTSGTSLMTGNIGLTGEMTFTPTGREGMAAIFFSSIGVAPWNITPDDGVTTETLYDTFSTGTKAAVKGKSSVTMTGSALQDSGVNSWSGSIVSAGNVNGQYWTGFDNVLYTEQFNVSIALDKGLPNAIDDFLATNLNTQLDINVANDLITPNDTHADVTEALSYVSFSTTDSGCITDPDSTVSETGGVITYIPDPSFTDGATDCFTYTITDSVGIEQSTAEVNITITGALPPVAEADAVATTEDVPLILDPVHGSFAVSGVVLDSDPVPSEIPGLLITAVDAVSVNGGTITQAAGTNNLTYTPATDYFGPDSFDYTITNSVPLLDSTTVTITVAAVNDAPVCTDAGITTAIDAVLTINVADDLLSTTGAPPLCVDAEGDTVTLASIDANGSSGGTMADDGAGTLTYTPAAGFLGDETFNYTATDGETASAANTLTINVADPLASNFTMLSAINLVFGGTNDVEIVWDEVSFNSNADDGNGVPTDTNFGLMTIASDEPFNGSTWTAHHVRIFKNTTGAPIIYKFDVTCEKADYDSGNVVCNKPLVDQGALQQYIFLPLQPGEIGVHILFDWNKAKDIDVVNVWKENAPWDRLGGTGDFNKLWLFKAGVPPDPETDWRLVSTDVANDGVDNVNGSPMVDGPFLGFFANFNYKPATSGGVIGADNSTIKEVDVDDFAFSMGWLSLLAGLLSVFGLRKRRINS